MGSPILTLILRAYSRSAKLHFYRVNAFSSSREKRAGLTSVDHLFFSRHCTVYRTDIVSLNLYNRLTNNLPNVTKLLSGWEYSQPRLFLTPKTMLIKEKQKSFEGRGNVSRRLSTTDYNRPKSLAADAGAPAASSLGL